MSLTTSKALIVDSIGATPTIKEVPVPKPAAGEILIKVEAVSLNPFDWKIHKLGLGMQFPVITGYDPAGEVVALGEGVTDFAVGDKVFSQALLESDRGAFQQYVALVAAATSKIPSNITVDQAAALPVSVTTAYLGLYNEVPHGIGIDRPVTAEARGKYTGTPILITGGTGSVGQTAIQFARISGFSPIITTANPSQTEYLRSLGATDVIERSLSTADAIEAIKTITGGALIPYIYDTISVEQTQQLSFELLAEGGKVVLVGLAPNAPEGSRTTSYVFSAPRAPQNVALIEELYHNHLFGFVEEGLIKPNNIEILPGGLAGIQSGLERLEKGQVSAKKLIVRPQETA